MVANSMEAYLRLATTTNYLNGDCDLVAAHTGYIKLNVTDERLKVRSHCRTQFMQNRPRSMVGVQSQFLLQVVSADPILLFCHVPCSSKQILQCSSIAIEDRSNSY